MLTSKSHPKQQKNRQFLATNARIKDVYANYFV